MAIVGGDAPALIEFAREMERRAASIADATNRLGRLVEDAAWVGPDRDAFVTEWRGQHAASLMALVHELGESAVRIVRHAEDQEAASR